MPGPDPETYQAIIDSIQYARQVGYDDPTIVAGIRANNAWLTDDQIAMLMQGQIPEDTGGAPAPANTVVPARAVPTATPTPIGATPWGTPTPTVMPQVSNVPVANVGASGWSKVVAPTGTPTPVAGPATAPPGATATPDVVAATPAPAATPKPVATPGTAATATAAKPGTAPFEPDPSLPEDIKHIAVEKGENPGQPAKQWTGNGMVYTYTWKDNDSVVIQQNMDDTWGVLKVNAKTKDPDWVLRSGPNGSVNRINTTTREVQAVIPERPKVTKVGPTTPVGEDQPRYWEQRSDGSGGWVDNPNYNPSKAAAAAQADKDAQVMHALDIENARIRNAVATNQISVDQGKAQAEAANQRVSDWFKSRAVEAQNRQIQSSERNQDISYATNMGQLGAQTTVSSLPFMVPKGSMQNFQTALNSLGSGGYAPVTYNAPMAAPFPFNPTTLGQSLTNQAMPGGAYPGRTPGVPFDVPANLQQAQDAASQAVQAALAKQRATQAPPGYQAPLMPGSF
ncbi:MAG: hypothetical protein QG671_3511 [Actinomycetota bacterium]|nr:hypothetical protein [Actinomycetota bacterium]